MNTSGILIILILSFIWIHLTKSLNKVSGNISELKKEIEKLRQASVSKEEKTTVPSTVTPQQAPSQTVRAAEPPVISSAPSVSAPAAKPVLQPVPETPKPTIHKPEIKKAAPAPRKKINYEKLIGENLFGKIGILILIFGIGLFVKYAIDNEWINETMRTILSFAVGSSLLFIAQRLHKKYRTFSSLLAGGAFAIFYITTAIAFHYYELFSQTAAFIILVAITLFMSALSILYDRRELAIISLAGGFLAPFLVSSGEGNYITLFTYILILDSGMFALAIYKKWKELPIISFVFTWLCLFIYILATPLSGDVPFHLLSFATGFYLLFLFPVVYILKNDPQKMGILLLIVLSANNFIYMGLGITLLNSANHSLKISGLLTLFIALSNLLTAIRLKKVLAENRRLLFTLLGGAVTFVSITIPLQLEGNYITIFWASEMVLLLWLFHKSGFRIYHYFSTALVVLTLISWSMDLYKTFDDNSLYTNPIFFNGVFATNLFVSIAYLGYASMCQRLRRITATIAPKANAPFDVAVFFTGIVIGWIAFDTEFRLHISNWMTAASIRALFISFYLLLMSILLQKKFPFSRYPIGYTGASLFNILLFMCSFETWTNPASVVFPWIALGFVVTQAAFTARGLCRQYDVRAKKMDTFHILSNVIATVLLLFATYILLSQTGSRDEFSAGISICLALIGFTQMILGMRLHLRIWRMISIVTLGIVIAKLLLIDLWSMPTIGKIIVFVILGTILLLLSFMYQKLKDILIKDDPDEK